MTAERKTIRVRIAVAVAVDGSWNSCGWKNSEDGQQSDKELSSHALDCMSSDAVVHYVEADIPLPTTIDGEVVSG